MSKIKWRSEPISVKKLRDELWIAEKFQSNSEIAGSPRNSFRASLEVKIYGGRALNEVGANTVTELYQTTNTKCVRTRVRLRELSSVGKRERAQIVN